MPAALGYAAALEVGESLPRYTALRARLEGAIDAEVIGDGSARSPLIGAYRMPGVSAAAQLIRFDLAGISVSAGSACSSGSMRPSHVLSAMGYPDEEARGALRLSLGRTTTEAEIEAALAIVPGIIARLRDGSSALAADPLGQAVPRSQEVGV